MNKPHFRNPLILSFSTILLLCLSFPPADLGYLAWVACIPWFILIVTEEKYICLYSLGIGAIFFIIQLSWLRYIAFIAWVLLSLYCSAYFLAFAFCTRYITTKLKLPFVVVVPCIWTAMEFVRSFLLSGFPWFFIGHTQYLYLPVIQIADITGVYGISLIIIMSNAAIADLLSRSFTRQRRAFFKLTCILPSVVLAISILYGFSWLRHYHPKEGPVVCMVQGNIPQDLKFESTEDDQLEILKKYTDLSESIQSTPIDLLVWPETMMPGILNIDSALTGRKIDLLSQLTATSLAQKLNTNLLLGGIALTFEGEEQVYFNSAYYYNRAGAFIDRYDKIHLVPFGEFTPLRNYFPFLGNLVPYEIGLTHGHRRIVFPLETLQNEYFIFGASICYEDTVPSLIRKFKRDGVDFMLNITNDGWFRDSAELDQHLAIMVFRAVENRIPMARAANTGISSFVSPDGTIYDKLTDSAGKYREISGTLTNRIKFVNKYTPFYTLYGDWLAILCVAATGITLMIAIIKPRSVATREPA
ncbi:Apolipoprotein N-acyltransferase [Candidatus Brocadiaceae bacterium B188]|nr:apolipoprotein N-acyltransferase [Candidatus Brocadia sapporoensis]TWU53379.1 Apolipoprotein N-acyltransferase [Candidatus Brocadiaceae bacterium B188]